METPLIDDTTASSAVTGPETPEVETVSTDATAESSTAPGAESDSPTEGDKHRAEIHKLFDEAEGTKPAADSPTTRTDGADDGDVSDGAEPKKDEPGAAKETTTADASQEAEFNKGFASDARWQKLVKLVPKGQEKELRAVAREFLTTEHKLKAQVEKARPALEYVDRIKRTGVELENTVALVESWQRGDEQAEKILQDLITDLQTRRGTVLSTPELVAESKELDQQLADGMVDETYVTKRKAELLELQKGKAVLKQTEAQKAEAAKQAEQQKLGKLFQACDAAFANWEKAGPLKNPDYTPELKKLMMSVGDQFVADKANQLGRYLNPAEVVECSQKAYEQVLGAMKSALPKRTVIKAAGTGGNSSTNSRREPTNDRQRWMAKLDELEAGQ
jgi:hypothetical protein